MSTQPFFVPAVIILVVSLPLVLGLIPRNRVYGIRTRQTLSDDRTWYSVNRMSVPHPQHHVCWPRVA